VSTLDDLANGQFHNVIGEVERSIAKKARRVIVCSGKVYYELLAYRRRAEDRRRRDSSARAAVSVSASGIQGGVANYAEGEASRLVPGRAAEPGRVVPAHFYLRADIDAGKSLYYAGRPVSASPRSAIAAKHMAEQKQLIEDAFAPELKSGEMVLAR
jgi:2-oxoglutarate dehydrogenase E1 component